MAKKYFVSDLSSSIGLTDEEQFAVVSSEKKRTKNDQPYLDLTLRDRTGTITAKVWSDNLEQVEEHRSGVVAKVDFEVREYRGRPELIVRKLEVVRDFDPDDYVLEVPFIDGEQLKTKLQKRIDSIRDYNLRQLVDAFFDDEDFYQSYINAPAGMRIHHNYRHGLLQHTLEMLGILDAFIDIYPSLNRDLITVATIFHDVGKIKELSVSLAGTTDYTKEGKFIGHIGIGLLLLEKRIPDDFPEELKMQLFHIILSHQGKLETGSPVLPVTHEAFAVYYADLTSTYLNIVEYEKRKSRESKSQQEFSNYNKYLENSVYVDPS